MSGWVGVDLDATLARYDAKQFPAIGEPIPEMVALVRQFLDAGVEVRIFTARVCPQQDPDFLADQHTRILQWTEQHIGTPLLATAVKDFEMVCLFDDRCWQVESNTGQLVSLGIDIAGFTIPTAVQRLPEPAPQQS